MKVLMPGWCTVTVWIRPDPKRPLAISLVTSKGVLPPGAPPCPRAIPSRTSENLFFNRARQHPAAEPPTSHALPRGRPRDYDSNNYRHLAGRNLQSIGQRLVGSSMSRPITIFELVAR